MDISESCNVKIYCRVYLFHNMKNYFVVNFLFFVIFCYNMKTAVMTSKCSSYNVTLIRFLCSGMVFICSFLKHSIKLLFV